MQIQQFKTKPQNFLLTPALNRKQKGSDFFPLPPDKNTSSGGLDQWFPEICNTSPPTSWTQWTLWCAKLSGNKTCTCIFYNAVSICSIQQRLTREWIAMYADINRTVQKQDCLDTMQPENNTLIFGSHIWRQQSFFLTDQWKEIA